MRFLLAALILAFASSAFAQEKGKNEPMPLAVVELKRTDPVSYDKDIEPLFYKKCTVCHSGKELKGKLDLSSYESLIKGGQRGPTIIPAKGNESLIYKVVHREMKPFMPPKGEDPVTPEELALIKLLIHQSAKAPTG